MAVYVETPADGRLIDDKYEYITGSALFYGISKKKKKNLNIMGSEQDDQVTLSSLVKFGSASDHPNISYHGYGGTDSLIYDGQGITAIDLKVADGDIVTIEGGYRRGYLGSLTVKAYNVEIFNFTDQDDTADFNGLSYGVTAYGEGGHDTLKGTQHNDTLHGGKGNDTIYGYGGNDYISGGEGADTIYGGSGADRIEGGKGNDTIWGGSSGNTAESANEMHGGEGDDTIHGATNFELTKDNVDIAYGGSGHDKIWGYDGDDVLDGGTGADTIYGGTGNDIISSGSMKDQTASDQLWGGSGADMFIIGDGSTDYTSDFVLDISAAFSDKGNSWTSILDTAGLLVSGFGGYSKLAWLGGTTVRAVANGFDTFYKMTGSRKTTFTIDADWGTVSETAVNDFNPLEDHILIPMGNTAEGASTNYLFEWEPSKDYAFTLRDNRDNADYEILGVKWADDLVDSFPDYMTVNGKGVTINSVIMDGLRASLKESYVSYDGTSLYFGDEIQELDEGWTGEMAGSGVAYMDLGAYAGWTIYDNEDDNDTWVGTNLNDILGAFVPVEANKTAQESGYYADEVVLYGMGGDDLLFGGAGDDIINGGENLDGTADSDTVAFFGADSVVVDLGTKIWKENLGIYYSVSSATYSIKTNNEGGSTTKVDTDVLYFIENVIGSDGNDIIKGDNGENILSGAGGNDNLTGGGGFDTFVFTGDSGKDTITDLDTKDVLVFEGLSKSDYNALMSSLSKSGNSLAIDSGNSVTWTGLDKSSFLTSVSANETDASKYDVTIATSALAERAYNGEFTNLTDTLDFSAVKQSTTASSANKHLVSNVLDGDTGTFNHTKGSDKSHWLRINLGEDALIEFIDLENRQDNDLTSDRLIGAEIKILDDGDVVWTSSELTSDHNQMFDIGGIVGDQVLVTHPDGDYLHIAEIDIYGDFIA